MPAYNGRIVETEFKSGMNILASEHFQFVHGGATLDAAAIGAKTLKCGTAIARNLTTGKYEEYADDSEGGVPEGYDNFSILNIDVELDGSNDMVVGEVIIAGSVYEDKLTGVTDAFKQANDNIIYVKDI